MYFYGLFSQEPRGAMFKTLPSTVYEMVVTINRYINKMGHSRAISAHWDIAPLLQNKWSREFIQVCIFPQLRLCHHHNDLTQLLETECPFFWRLTTFNVDLFDIRAIINHDREKCLLWHNLFFIWSSFIPRVIKHFTVIYKLMVLVECWFFNVYLTCDEKLVVLFSGR